MIRYPNLELFNYIFYEKIANYKNKEFILYRADSVYVFPQTWPNTGGGFSKPGNLYGQAMTTEYTTVLIDLREDMAMVCFGEKPAYIVSPITERFMDDVRAMKMARQIDAKQYNDA